MHRLRAPFDASRRSRSLMVVAALSYGLFLFFDYREAVGDIEADDAERIERLAHELELRLAEKDLSLLMIAQTTSRSGLAKAAELMDINAQAEHLGRMAAADAQGVIRADNRPNPSAIGLDVSDRDYFRHFADDPNADDLFIGSTVFNRSGGELATTVARAARDDAGALLAVHVTAIAPWIVDNILAGANLERARGEAVLIARRDGETLLRIDDRGLSAPVDPDWSPLKPGTVQTRAALDDFPITVAICAPPGAIALRAGLAAAPGATLGLVLLAMALLVIRLRDIGARQRAADQERALAQLSELLELSGNRFYEIDAAGLCTVARGAWNDGTPIDASQFIGRPFMQVVQAFGTEPSASRLAAALKKGVPFGRLFAEITPPGQGLCFSALSGTPLTDDAGERTGWRLMAVDITEQVTDKVRAAELKTALDTKTRLIAAITHDMRQPVQALMLFLGLARDAAVEPKAQEGIERATEIAGSLVRQIGALADLGRVESEMIRPHLIHTDIRPLLERAAAEQAAIAAARGVKVRTVLPDAEVVTDPMLLERVVDNILNNAVKFARKRVLIGARRHGPHLLIEVMDDGPGIAPDHRELIFHAWENRDALPRTGAEGTGIGLAISRQITEALGVAIRLTSRPGRGARFTLELPAEPTPHAPLRHPARHDAASVIMAVDDDPAIRAALTAALTTDSCGVFAYPNGETALASDLDGLRPKAFLIDLNLGDGMDGGQLIQRLMDRPGGAAAAYFVLSGEPPETVKHMLGDLPVRAVLRKPIRLDDLKSAVEAAIAGA